MERRIIIADDEPRFANSLKFLFTQRGFEVKTCLNGEEALEIFEEFPVKVVVTDIEMPKKNGLDLLPDLVRLDEFVQVIFLTGRGTVENIKEAFQASRNTFEFFTKPLKDMEVLFQAVESAQRKYDTMKKALGLQRKAEQNLVEAGQIFDALETMIYVSDMDTYDIIYSNRKFNQVMGYDPYGSQDRPKCWQIIHGGQQAPCRFCTNPRIMDDKGRPAGPFEWEFESKKAGRRYAIVDKAIEWHDHRVVRLSTLRDITERRKYEQLFKEYEKKHLQVKKLKSLSTLAGGISHQFNNALSVISGNLELIEMVFSHDGKLNRYTGNMHQAIEKMAQLTASLLAYAQGGKYKTRPVIFNDLLHHILKNLDHMLGENVVLNTCICAENHQVSVDSVQIRMLLKAIFENALEAGCRTLSVTCDMEIPPGNDLDNPGLENQDHICLKIEDDGSGMDEDILANVFEPFFTTKFQGRGLGMSAVYGIVKGHQGRIAVDSILGSGTRVSIYFPIFKTAPPKKINGNKQGLKLNVLLVEDKDDIRSSTRVMLEKMGHTVFEAGTGRQAIDFLESHDSPIHLALLNYLMPDFKADLIYPMVVREQPEAEVVILNSGGITAPVQRLLDSGAGSFMQKPVTVDELAEKIRQIQEAGGKR